MTQHKDTTLDFLDQISEYNKLGGRGNADLADTCNICGISPSKLKAFLIQWRDKAVVEQLRKDRLANAKFWKSNIDTMFDREIEVYETALKETPNED